MFASALLALGLFGLCTRARQPNLAHRFVSDRRAYHAEPNKLKRDEIAGGTLRMLKEHYAGKLRVPDVKRMFEEMHKESEGP
jgi:hypothetical protein